MHDLKQLQQTFYDAIFARDEQDTVVQAISKHINSTETLSAYEHFDIYRNNVISTFMVVLGDIYPVCKRLLGEEFFDAMAQVYISKASSLSPDIGDYGSDFSDFIKSFEPAKELPYLSAVVQLEWAWHRAFNAEDFAEFDFQRLAEIAGEDKVRIVFQPNTTLVQLESDYPVIHIWETNHKDYKGDDTVNLDEGGEKFAVWRHALEMYILPFNDQEWLFVNLIVDKNPFGEICEKFAATFPQSDIGEVLGGLLANGVVVDFKLESS